MSTLVLLTAPDCHLCEHAHEVLAALAAERDLSWRDIAVDSSEGRRLAGGGSAIAAGPPPAPAPTPPPPPAPGMNERILIIDDEPWVHEVVRAYLERDGFIVYGASDGREGLELAMTKRPDLVVLDLMLPDLSGEEICRQLRERSDVRDPDADREVQRGRARGGAGAGRR